MKNLKLLTDVFKMKQLSLMTFKILILTLFLSNFKK
jgi:hypothetical protein